MDDIVLRSMMKWPDVPAVYGWLRLDRRGRWLIRMPGEPARFERIVHTGLNEFIGRNYACDGEGRYFFQNGPQRVYVGLEYTPWVYRLDDAGARLVTHTGVPAGAIRAAHFDEHAALLLECETGVGEVLDRDLAAIEERLRDANDAPLDVENLLREAQAGRRPAARLMHANVVFDALRAGAVPARFGFVPDPRPPAGQPDC